MKAILSERNIVVVLFVMVLITFSLAQEDSKKMEKMQNGSKTATASAWFMKQPIKTPVAEQAASTPQE